MYRYYLFLPFLFIVCHLEAQSVRERFQYQLDSILGEHPTAIGIMAHVEAPDQGISWSGASGYSDQASKTALHPEQPALIASSIKTYVAASILRLVEMELISLDDTIASLVSEKSRSIFENDGYNFSEIKVKHLLSHTSGIEDYANQAYIDLKKEKPMYRWTRDEQLALAVSVGNPLAEPGNVFSYADANYLLITEILEHTTGKPFYEAMRSLLRYDEIGISNTWFPTLEKEPKNTLPMAHQYWGSYDWDTYHLDISWDLFGGGGIACPTKDLARFTQKLFNSEVIKSNNVLNQIFTEIPTKETEIYPYYLGLSQDAYHGMNGFGHGGFWGTVMMYFPYINATISVYILDRDKRILRRPVMDALSNILLSEHEAITDQETDFNAYLNNLSDFSGTILIGHNDEIVEERAYGQANIEYKIDNNIETKFNIASITKMITATAIMQLVDQEKINLQNTVGNYLPDFSNHIIRDSVTIHQLLTHTSGIPAFYDESYLQSNKLKYKKIGDYSPLFIDKELKFSPGSTYEYAGGGFVVLGLILESVTGMDYYDYIENNICDMAGMKNTIAFSPDTIIHNVASGYTRLFGDQMYLSKNEYYISKASPAGGYYSTARDLFSFMTALRTNALFDSETTELMCSPKVKGYNTHLGYGIDVDRRFAQEIIGHNGGWYGVRAEVMYFKSSGHSVVVLSNMDDDSRSGASNVIENIKYMLGGSRLRQ